MKNTENLYNEIQHILDSGPNAERLVELFTRLNKPSIVNAIENSFKKARERRWDRTYWFVDIHDTILIPNYGGTEAEEFYPLAKETLQLMSKRSDIVLSLYTCSWPREIQDYLLKFDEHNIRFDFINKNKDVKNTEYGYYLDKPYMNVLFDDKAGFNAKNDWQYVIDLLNKYPDGYALM